MSRAERKRNADERERAIETTIALLNNNPKVFRPYQGYNRAGQLTEKGYAIERDFYDFIRNVRTRPQAEENLKKVRSILKYNQPPISSTTNFKTIKPINAIPYRELVEAVRLEVGTKKLDDFKLTIRSGDLLIPYEITQYFRSFEAFEKWYKQNFEEHKAGSESAELPQAVKEAIQEKRTTHRALVKENRNAFATLVPEVSNPKAGAISAGYERKVNNGLVQFSIRSHPSSKDECGIAVLSAHFQEHNPDMEDIPTRLKELCTTHFYTLPLSHANMRRLFALAKEVMKSPCVACRIVDYNTVELPKRIFYVFTMRNTQGEDHYFEVVSTRVSPVIFNKRKVATFDFETRHDEHYVDENGKVKYYLRPALCKFIDEDGLIETFVGRDCVRQFLTFLNKQASKEILYSIRAHNGSAFDFFFVASEFTDSEKFNNQDGLILMGTKLLTFQYNGHKFIDSYRVYMGSLEKLSEDYKIPTPKLSDAVLNGQTLTSMQLCFYKPNLSFDEFCALQHTEPEFWTLYDRYCEVDCKALLEVRTAFNKCFKTALDGITERVRARRVKLLKTALLSTKSQKEWSIASKKLKFAQNNPNDPATNLSLQIDPDQAITLGSLAMKVFKLILKIEEDPLYTEYEKAIDTEEKDEFLRLFVRGGISYSKKIATTEPLLKYDVVSQYPASHLLSTALIGATEHIIAPSPEKQDRLRLMPGYFKISDLTFPEDAPAFKCICLQEEDGSLAWDTPNRITQPLYFTSDFLAHLREKYGKITYNIDECIVGESTCEVGETFGTFYLGFFDVKQGEDNKKAKKDPTYNESLRTTAKLFLNALIGKCVENTRDRFETVYSPLETKEKMNGESITRKQRGNANPFLQLGIQVYHTSKILMSNYTTSIESVVYQMETDSICFPASHAEAFNLNIARLHKKDPEHYGVGKRIGMLDFEGTTYGPAYLLAKKICLLNYRTPSGAEKNHTNLKGIPSKTLLPDGSYSELIHPEHFPALAKGESVIYHYNTLDRSLEDMSITSFNASREVRTPGVRFVNFDLNE